MSEKEPNLSENSAETLAKTHVLGMNKLLLERIESGTTTVDDAREVEMLYRRLAEAQAEVARLRRVADIAATILDVASHTHVSNMHLCPHGNAAAYPTHGWWCDGCFIELEDALAAIRAQEGQE